MITKSILTLLSTFSKNVKVKVTDQLEGVIWKGIVYGWPSYSQLIIFTSSKNIFTSSKNIFTGSRNKTLAKATHN